MLVGGAAGWQHRELLEGRCSPSAECSALLGEAAEPVPAEAAITEWLQSSRTLAKTCGDAEALQYLIGRIKELTGHLGSISPSCPDPLFPVFIMPSLCVTSDLGRKLPWDGTCRF